MVGTLRGAWISWILVALGSAVLLGACGSDDESESVSAPPPPSPIASDPVLADIGESRFHRYCASCHGLDGRGQGPVASILQVPPLDLRRIAARNGGDFPAGEVARKIDGRFEIASHGSREMPVWGRSFGSDAPEPGAGDAIARGEIAVLVEYLKSIQEGPDSPADQQALKRSMREILQAVQLLLPLSVSPQGFDDPSQAGEIREALALLDRSSAQLGRHGASGDAGFAHLARSLTIDARDIRLRYEEGHRNEARYLVHTLTETCVACHSRLPSGSAPASEAFLRDVELSDLPPAKRAKLAYATRQFDAALELYEEVMADEESPATDIDLGGHLDDYLELVIRVRRDPERGAAAIGAFARRDDLPTGLRAEARRWTASLERLAARKPPSDPRRALAEARALLSSDGPAGEPARHRLVENLEASSLLHGALAWPLTRDERAQAYYLLGLAQTRIGRTYWLSQAEAYLETAIRLAPGEPVARQAYGLLEDFLVAGYTGSAGTQLPLDVQEKLDHLRLLARYESV